MTVNADNDRVLRTSIGDFPLNEYRLKGDGLECGVLHVNAVLSASEEAEYLLSPVDRPPYGVALWAASIALAHEVAARSAEFRGAKVLELGAGTGLPGIAAASLGANVTQTDNNLVALHLARRNLDMNGLKGIEQRQVDWTDWKNTELYHRIIGSDILYSAEIHPHLRHIFESNLAPGGRVLLSDPFRASGLKLLEEMEESGWIITIGKWTIGDAADARPIGIFELEPPRQ
jgi:methyltransferase-like protein 23